MIIIIHNQNTHTLIHIGIINTTAKDFHRSLNDTYGSEAFLGYLKQNNNTNIYDPQSN